MEQFFTLYSSDIKLSQMVKKLGLLQSRRASFQDEEFLTLQRYWLAVAAGSLSSRVSIAHLPFWMKKFLDL
jgi:hypothetical protein